MQTCDFEAAVDFAIPPMSTIAGETCVSRRQRAACHWARSAHAWITPPKPASFRASPMMRPLRDKHKQTRLISEPVRRLCDKLNPNMDTTRSIFVGLPEDDYDKLML